MPKFVACWVCQMLVPVAPGCYNTGVAHVLANGDPCVDPMTPTTHPEEWHASVWGSGELWDLVEADAVPEPIDEDNQDIPDPARFDGACHAEGVSW